MARPSPVPPLRPPFSPTWTYGSAIFCWSSAEMPHPVSCTSNVRLDVVGLKLARTSTKPFLVNFIALPTRLKSTWRTRWASRRRIGISPAPPRTSRSLLVFEALKESTISCTRRRQSVGSGRISMRPASSLERSSTSLISWSSVFPLTTIESITCSRSTSSLTPSFNSWEKPMMALSGVRMSWLTVEKK